MFAAPTASPAHHHKPVMKQAVACQVPDANIMQVIATFRTRDASWRAQQSRRNIVIFGSHPSTVCVDQRSVSPEHALS